MIGLQASMESTTDDLALFQAQLRAAANRIGVESGGLAAIMVKGLGQLDRFVAANIQVRTGRTKNSIFQAINQDGNQVQAGLYSNVRYSPYVGHVPKTRSEQFFAYAAKTEGPRVAEATGLDVVAAIEGEFV